MRGFGVFILVTVFSANIFASDSDGGTGGNGGQSVVCRNDDGSIRWAENYDLYEGRLLFGYKYRRTASASLGASILARRMDKAVPSPVTLVSRLSHIADNFKIMEMKVPLTPDIEPTVVPDTCKLEQTAIMDVTGVVRVDREIWENLSELSRAAFFLHESVYWKLRAEHGEIDSRRTRRIVSYLAAYRNFSAARESFADFDTALLRCENRADGSTVHVYSDPSGRLGIKKGGELGRLTETFVRGPFPLNPFDLVLYTPAERIPLNCVIETAGRI